MHILKNSKHRLFGIVVSAAVALCSFSSIAYSAEHPNLILTQQGVEDIRAKLGSVPVFDKAVAQTKASIDKEIEMGIEIPIPKDFSGGYTHERHKRNFVVAQQAGLLYQILEDEKYAAYVKEMFFEYEAMYKNLPVHPQPRSYARGKLFWQCLNDSNWLVGMAQAYDTVYNYLSEEERATLEANLFRPFADFISVENPQFYNRIHNHSTWGNAAVGMIGLAMDDEELIDRALYGLEDDGLELGVKDDDGGFIKVAGQKAGFLANLEEPFSPEGYFTEGPYYQRYAMYPFLIFALGMENAKPEMGVLQHKDGVLLKAVYAMLNLTDKSGEFFALNDGQKGMSYLTKAVVAAVDIAYHYGDQDPRLLGIAQQQDAVVLDQSGLSVALGVQEGLAQPYTKGSVNYGDGPDGDQGGVAVLRYGDEDLSVVFKYSAQGLSHGHYDKLSYSMFEAGDEVIQDYGLSRFVNIEKKGGGNYLPENKTWAKQTVAHNTVVQNGKSHFGGKYEVGSQHHSELYFYDAEDKNVQVISALEKNAYPGTTMHRTMAMVKAEGFNKPFVIDLMRLVSEEQHQYDLPLYFLGQVLETSFEYSQPSSLAPLGDKHGYQHLYVEGEGSASDAGSDQFTWMNEYKYYTMTAATDASDTFTFARIGANDPDFNLRRDAGLMLSRKADSTVFASVIEPHGDYSPVTELSNDLNSNVESMLVLRNDEKYTAVQIDTLDERSFVFAVANKTAKSSKRHKLKVNGKTYKWKGPFIFSAE